LTSRTLRPPSPTTLRKISTASTASSASTKTLSRPALPNAKVLQFKVQLIKCSSFIFLSLYLLLFSSVSCHVLCLFLYPNASFCISMLQYVSESVRLSLCLLCVSVLNAFSFVLACKNSLLNNVSRSYQAFLWSLPYQQIFGLFLQTFYACCRNLE
jgi:hypothetical protein